MREGKSTENNISYLIPICQILYPLYVFISEKKFVDFLFGSRENLVSGSLFISRLSVYMDLKSIFSLLYCRSDILVSIPIQKLVSACLFVVKSEFLVYFMERFRSFFHVFTLSDFLANSTNFNSSSSSLVLILPNTSNGFHCVVMWITCFSHML